MNPRFSFPACVLLIAVAALVWAYFGQPAATRTTPAATQPQAGEDDPFIHVWDFRHGHSLEAVNWPKGFAGQDLGYSNTFLWRDDRPTLVQLIGVDGTHEIYEVARRQVRRIGDQVVSVGISLPGMTYDEVVDKFPTVAATWGITDLKNFELWRDRRRPGNNGAGMSSCHVRRAGNPEIYLTIRPNVGGRQGQDWYISLSFQEFEPREPATKPNAR